MICFGLRFVYEPGLCLALHLVPKFVLHLVLYVVPNVVLNVVLWPVLYLELALGLTLGLRLGLGLGLHAGLSLVGMRSFVFGLGAGFGVGRILAGKGCFCPRCLPMGRRSLLGDVWLGRFLRRRHTPGELKKRPCLIDAAADAGLRYLKLRKHPRRLRSGHLFGSGFNVDRRVREVCLRLRKMLGLGGVAGLVELASVAEIVSVGEMTGLGEMAGLGELAGLGEMVDLSEVIGVTAGDGTVRCTKTRATGFAAVGRMA